MKAVTLERDYSIKLSSSIVDFIYPDHVFIPMFEGFKLQVGNKSQIKKEQILLKNDFNIGVYSPISGTVVGVKECLLENGQKCKALVIENDFKEKLQERAIMRKSLKDISKKEFFNILEDKAILDFDNSFKLLIDLFKNKKIERIIINGIQDEPYMASRLYLLNKYYAEVLETLSFLSGIFKTKENIVLLKNNDRDNVENYSNVLGTYPEICLTIVPDIYPIGNINVLEKYIDCDMENSLILSPENVLVCYNAIKKNKRVSEKFITITGNAIINPIVVNAKIGSLVKKIIDDNIEFINNDEVDYAVNGLMCGKNLDIEDLIVTNELDGIVINFREEEKNYECINCGKCNEICPVGIDPNLVFNHNKKTYQKDKCINCGLCTYICPAYINFKNKIKEMQNEK